MAALDRDMMVSDGPMASFRGPGLGLRQWEKPPAHQAARGRHWCLRAKSFRCCCYHEQNNNNAPSQPFPPHAKFLPAAAPPNLPLNLASIASPFFLFTSLTAPKYPSN
ncbi:hypothetical protein CDD81_2922 [Ophiocordyceps australis]|uniref:Uncharacterized protein n=1 Tax=Ophiocordyceps australis TaxID=1399860 RepID=A0A2C5YHQ3_9HYPO|nr:hypothetical protein CDD81_2922 [Ophiocordyceps australis]